MPNIRLDKPWPMTLQWHGHTMKTFHALHASAQAELAALGLRTLCGHYDNFVAYMKRHSSFADLENVRVFHLERAECEPEILAQMAGVSNWLKVGFMTEWAFDHILDEVLRYARQSRKGRTALKKAAQAATQTPLTPDEDQRGAEATPAPQPASAPEPDYARLSAPELLAALRARGFVLRPHVMDFGRRTELVIH